MISCALYNLKCKCTIFACLSSCPSFADAFLETWLIDFETFISPVKCTILVGTTEMGVEPPQMLNDGTFVTPLVVIGSSIHSVLNFQQKSGFFSMPYLLFIVQHF